MNMAAYWKVVRLKVVNFKGGKFMKEGSNYFFVRCRYKSAEYLLICLTPKIVDLRK